jgi:hypothetical protein
MVQVIAREWLPALEKDRRAEATAVRLKAYCLDGTSEPPEGMHLHEYVADVQVMLEQRGVVPTQRSHGPRGRR